MPWLRERLTPKRLAVVGLLLTLAVVLIAVGDPLEHPEEGAQATGERGVAGIPRIVYLVGLAVAFVIALPPRRDGEPPGEG